MKKIYVYLSNLVIVVIIVIGSAYTAQAKTSGNAPTQMGNLVILATLQDDPNAAKMSSNEVYQEITDIYDGDHSLSFSGYLEAVSYGQLLVENTFPQDRGDYFEVLELPFTHAQFAGFSQDVMLIDYIVQQISPEIDPAKLDKNNDGILDNLTILIQSDPGSSTAEYPTLWPHHARYFGESTYQGLEIGMYNVMSSSRSYGRVSQGAGVTVHEFLHSIGYPDLYTYDGTSPVANFDIMSTSDRYMQYPLAYMRSAISGWVDIETVTESKTNVVLDLQSNPDGNQAYIIKSPLNQYEFFVVEYRKIGDSLKNELDSKLDSEGIIVYRVDTSVAGLTNKGDVPAIYIFRDQSLENPEQEKAAVLAALSKESGRTSIGTTDLSLGLTDGALTFQDGTNSGIVISNVSSAGGATMSFDVEIPEAASFDLWNDAGFVDSNPSTKSLSSVLGSDGLIYLLEASGNNLILHKQNGNTYTKISEYSAGNSSSVTESELFIFKDELYASYIHYGNTDAGETNDAIILRFNASSGLFDEYATVKNAGDQSAYAINVDAQSMYISYTSGIGTSQQNLAKIINGSVEILGIYSEESGRPDIALNNGKIYVFNRLASNDIKMYEYTGSRFVEITSTNFNSNSFDIISHAEKLYLLTADSGITLYSFDSSNWTKEASMELSGFSPRLTVSQGNLYLITSTGSSSGNTDAFRVDLAEKTFVKEGYNIDVSSNHYNIISIGEKLYATYVGKDNKIRVKVKESSNKLVSITITPPSTLDYLKGDLVSENGMKVVANYEQNQRTLERREYTITGFDSTIVGERMATVTFGEITRNFEYYVREKEIIERKITNLEITIQPTDKNYFAGETFHVGGMKVKASYTDGSVDNDFASYEVHYENGNAFSIGDTKVTLSAENVTVQVTGISVVPKPMEAKVIVNKETSTASIFITPGAESDNIKSVYVPTWSSVNGQDDIIWYRATKQSDGTYVVHVHAANHKYSTGEYFSHMYTENVFGQLTWGTATTFAINPGKSEVTVYGENNASIRTIELSNAINQRGNIVNVAVWSAERGQDDLRWINMNLSEGKYTLLLDMNRFASSGDYIAHVYQYNSAGEASFVNATRFQVDRKTEVDITVKSLSSASGTAWLIIDPGAITGGVEVIYVPTWSDINGQDDIVWYKAWKQNDGTYTVNFNAANHKYSEGRYTSHVYTVNQFGQMTWGDATAFYINPGNSELTISGDNHAGIRTMELSNSINQKGNTVNVAVWSAEGGQDDLHWINMTLNGGKYTLPLDINSFTSSGDYFAHVYQFNSAGTPSFVTATTFKVDRKTGADVRVENLNQTSGTARLVIEPDAVVGGLNAVYVPTWSSANDQDDIVWYRAGKQSDGTYIVTFNKTNHKYSTGTYNVHVYIENLSGAMMYAQNTSFLLN